jgi:transposase-like protein
MASCDNISKLARELGIRRKLLYKWKDEAEEADRHPQRDIEQSSAEERLAKRVREVEALAEMVSDGTVPGHRAHRHGTLPALRAAGGRMTLWAQRELPKQVDRLIRAAGWRRGGTRGAP